MNRQPMLNVIDDDQRIFDWLAPLLYLSGGENRQNFVQTIKLEKQSIKLRFVSCMDYRVNLIFLHLDQFSTISLILFHAYKQASNLFSTINSKMRLKYLLLQGRIYRALTFVAYHSIIFIMKAFLCVILPLILAASVPGDGIEGCTGFESPFALSEQLPELVATVPNGKKYTLDYDGRKFYIVSVRGTAYEMGLAYGTLMKEELRVMEKDFFGWAANFIANNVTQISMLPKWMRQDIGKTGVSLAKKLLDVNYLITKKYTPKRWNDEFKGVGKGSGISHKTWRRINLIPELLKASCSIGGWWGPATETGQLIQLRALDWEEHAPISKFPTITVYHPTEAGSVPFANIAWAGFFGSLTGYSSAKIGVSERLRGGPASTMTRFGKPWTYALRDVLQFSKTIDDALNNLNNTHRTCSVYLGIGSSVNNTYRIIEYSETEFNVYDDTNWHFGNTHPKVEGMIWKAYHDDKTCFKNHFMPNYGKITPEHVWRYVAPRSETGDSQVIVMDFSNNNIYAMYPNPETHVPGYNRPAIRIDLTPHFNEKW